MEDCEITSPPLMLYVEKEFSENASATTKATSEVQDDDMIFDIGPDSADQLAEIMKNAGTIVWNGPVGRI